MNQCATHDHSEPCRARTEYQRRATQSSPSTRFGHPSYFTAFRARAYRASYPAVSPCGNRLGVDRAGPFRVHRIGELSIVIDVAIPPRTCLCLFRSSADHDNLVLEPLRTSSLWSIAYVPPDEAYELLDRGDHSPTG
jgi:hypothetical protein